MFTGIVEATGEILKAEPAGGGLSLWIRSDALAGAAVGASVAVSGVCLTVAERDGDTCRFDVAPETAVRSTLGAKRAGDRVNVERPVRVGAELGGHIVQGHVDGTGTQAELVDDDTGRRLSFSIDPGLARYVVEKGSVAVDGVALTVTKADDRSFEVMLIPHTLAVTTLGAVEKGDAVNVEVDVLAKYVERLMQTGTRDPSPDESGYL